jgi:hypothetical protein
MSGFKPSSQQNRSSDSGDREYTGSLPTPKSGSRKARVSLIIDLGTQKREAIYKESAAPNAKIVDEDTPNAVRVEQKDCQQVVVFADLVADNVDYGGKIGTQQYRLMLNKSYMGAITGINFTASPPMDAKGNRIKDKPWGLHHGSILSKIAKAVGKPEVIESMDISELLNEPFMATVEVKEQEDKNGKEDKDGNVIVYKNVNYKGAAEVPKDDDDNPLPVAALKQPARCVTFDNAKKEDIQFIRPSIIKLIKKATNYEGSKMEAAIEAWEAEQGSKSEAAPADEAPAATKPVAKSVIKKKPVVEDDDQDVPF